MLDANPEVSVSRSRIPALIVVALVTVGLAACSDDSSDTTDRPRKTTTTSSPTSSTTSTTVGPGGETTIPTQPDTPTSIPPSTVGNCGNQTDALVAAIEGSDSGGLNSRVGQFTVQRCRIAASSPIWAAADVVPKPGFPADPAQVLLQRIGALWNVESVGTSNVGCAAPASVRVDLGLICSG